SKAEKQAVAGALDNVKGLASVIDVQNPFTAQAKLDQNRQKLIDGKQALLDAPAKLRDAQKKLNAGKAKLADAQTKLDAGQAKLDAGKKKLNAAAADLDAQAAQVAGAISQLQAAGAPAEQIDPMLAAQAKIQGGQAAIKLEQAKLVAAQATIDAGQKKIDSGNADIVTGQKKNKAGWAKVKTNTPKLVTGAKLMAAIKNFRTVSENGQTASATVIYNKPITSVQAADKEAVVASLSAFKYKNIQVEFSAEMTRSMPQLLGPGEIIGLVSAAVVLFIMLGTFVAAGLPVVSAIIGVGISATATMALSGALPMTATTPMLGVMLGLAVGIDYSLFILNRHRRQLKLGTDVRESIGLANGTSGNAVVFAGLTVIIALVALNLTGVDFLGLMGTVAAGAILVAVSVALTFTPAVLSLLGTRVLNKRERAKLAAADSTDANSSDANKADQPKSATRDVFVTKHPWITILATALILIFAAQPLSSMRLGLPDGSSEPVESTQYKTFKLAEQAFGAGVNGPIVVVATSQTALKGQAKLEFQANLATALMKNKSVSSVLPAAVSKDGSKYLFQVIPQEGPASASTEKLVFAIRAQSDSIQERYGATVGVTGLAASNIDLAKKLGDALPGYLTTILVLSLLLLILVFRSILIPLIASAGFMLTVFATLGATVAVFQWGWLGFVFGIHDPGPVMSFVPTIIIGVVFGLAMDYQLFLGSGMREAFVHGKSPRESINFGIHLSRA
ncbi:MAG: MMPL family transporter, partial [Rhodoluna sp.]